MVKVINQEFLQKMDLLNALSTSVVLLDKSLRIVLVNSSAQALFSTSELRLKDRLLAECFPALPALYEAALRALTEQSSFVERGLRLSLPNQEKLVVDCTFAPIWEKGRDPSLVLVEIFNLARLQGIRHDGHLILQNDAASAVLQGLAHEVKNPLGGIRGAAQLLEKELVDKSLVEYTQVIIGEADRLRCLVDRMVEPRGILEMTLINVHEVLEHVRFIVNAEHSEHIKIKDDYDPSIPDLNADRDKLIQALLNLMRNAAQALSSEGGIIILRTRVHRKFTIGSELHRLVLAVQIIDDGPGIDPELSPSIFFPLVSGRAEGTGLGLSIAQSIVKRQGGMIGFESEPGKTIFTVWLPLGEDE
jgi:two-component system nitrogen regulation sensor histidine kinase GlnL